MAPMTMAIKTKMRQRSRDSVPCDVTGLGMPRLPHPPSSTAAAAIAATAPARRRARHDASPASSSRS